MKIRLTQGSLALLLAFGVGAAQASYVTVKGTNLDFTYDTAVYGKYATVKGDSISFSNMGITSTERLVTTTTGTTKTTYGKEVDVVNGKTYTTMLDGTRSPPGSGAYSATALKVTAHTGYKLNTSIDSIMTGSFSMAPTADFAEIQMYGTVFGDGSYLGRYSMTSQHYNSNHIAKQGQMRVSTAIPSTYDEVSNWHQNDAGGIDGGPDLLGYGDLATADYNSLLFDTTLLSYFAQSDLGNNSVTLKSISYDFSVWPAAHAATVASARMMSLDPVAAVPEPATCSLMFAGLGVIGLVKRRRTVKSA